MDVESGAELHGSAGNQRRIGSATPLELAGASEAVWTRPSLIVAVLAVFHLALWGALSGVMAVAPPSDSLEQVLLSQELRPEYGKHPPLPTWILFAVARVFAPSIAATYLLGAASAVLAMILLYRFAAPLVGRSRAALAALLALNVEYMNAGTAYFNHNTVQLPLAVTAIWMFHRALTGGGPWRWALLGLACGAMLLAKFSAVILFASFGVYLLWAGRWRDSETVRGVALATLVAAVVLSPYLLAVRSDAWSPNAYAMDSLFPHDVARLECLKTVWGFASSQLAKVAPALMIFFFLRRTATPPAVAPAPEHRGVELNGFLAVVGFGPLVLTVIIAALSGAYLLVGWGTTFHVLLTFWLVSCRPFGIAAGPSTLRKAAALTALVQIALWTLVTMNDGRLPNLNRTAHRARPPTPVELSGAVEQQWAHHCAAPLRYVLADAPSGAALAVMFGGQPRVIDVTRPEHVKFFSEDRRMADGAMIVARLTPTGTLSDPTGPLASYLSNSQWRSTLDLRGRDGAVHSFALAVIPPSTGAGCEFSLTRPAG